MKRPSWLSRTPPLRRRYARLRVQVLNERTTPATITWTGNVDSSWFTNNNWAGNVRPGPTDVAKFDNPGNNAPTISATYRVGGLITTSNWNQVITVDGTLFVDGSSLLEGSGNIVGTGTLEQTR